MSTTVPADGLLRRASRAMFWNALMLPAITVINLAGAVLLRRGFGLESGTYDTALGVLNTLLTYSGLGLPFTVAQFVPGLARNSGRASAVRFLGRVVPVRFVLLAAALAAVNVFAGTLADSLNLGSGGVRLIRMVSALAALRAGSDLAIDVLQALLAHGLANLVQLVQAVALAGAVIWTVWAHATIATLFGLLAAAAACNTVLSTWLASRQIRAVPPDGENGAAIAGDISWRRIVGFAAFMFLVDASNYFATPAFASPALAAVSHGQTTTALFNVAFQIPMMAVVVILSGFQGLYRPLFAGIIADGDPGRLRTAFSEIGKVQTMLLVPAGIGLFLLLPDYVLLLFGRQFAASVPLARILTLFLVAEALLTPGFIILSVDRRYWASLGAQAARALVAPVFVWLAVRGQLDLAAAVFGGGRLLAVGLGFLMARRRYGVRYAGPFTMRVALAAAPMALVVFTSGLVVPSTVASTLARTALGAATLVFGLRWFAVLGPRELDILRRTRMPGAAMLACWLTKSGDAASRA
ncbi:MAG: hypothetical protein AB7Q29_11135 [Vicinamibacterales bacterium]